VSVFKPAGCPARQMDWVLMTVDEYEALRLVDGDGLEQAEAAEQMGVSRPTVTRILARARAKLAQMIRSGAALAIEGGAVCPCPEPNQRGCSTQLRHRRGCGPGRGGSGQGGSGRGRGGFGGHGAGPSRGGGGHGRGGGRGGGRERR